MKTIIRVIVFTILVNLAKADLCSENFTLSEFPQGVLKEVISIATKGVIDNFFGCPDHVEINDDEIHFWLYTKDNPDKPILLNRNNPTELDISKSIKMMLPGWLCNVTNSNMPMLKNAYLEKDDSNVIGIDWTKYSIDLYVNSFCFIEEIAKLIGKFLCDLNENFGYNLETVHLIGHSMGGQMSGFIGKETQKQCQKMVGRITGLDPAGPLYQGLNKDRRLDKTDAQFVDVIHSNQGFLGYFGNCGHKDFYPNCGVYQRGCLKINGETPIHSIINLPSSIVACNHLRSVEYFSESINSDNFIATSCRTCPGVPVLGLCSKDLIFASETNMGEYTPTNSSYHKYYVRTNKKAPYAQG